MKGVQMPLLPTTRPTQRLRISSISRQQFRHPSQVVGVRDAKLNERESWSSSGFQYVDIGDTYATYLDIKRFCVRYNLSLLTLRKLLTSKGY